MFEFALSAIFLCKPPAPQVPHPRRSSGANNGPCTPQQQPRCPRGPEEAATGVFTGVNVSLR